MDFKHGNTSPLDNSIISTHAGSCTRSHRTNTSLAGLQTGTQATSWQVLFILLVTTTPKADRAKTERRPKKG